MKYKRTPVTTKEIVNKIREEDLDIYGELARAYIIDYIKKAIKLARKGYSIK